MIEEQFRGNIDDLINFDENFFEIQLNNICLYKEYQKQLTVFFNEFVLDDIVYTSKNGETVIIQVKNDDKFIKLSIKASKFDDFEAILSVVYSNIAHSIAERLYELDSYYIPSERLEIIMDKKTLSRRLKNESELSKNQSEVLSNIIKINPSKKGYFYDLACDFEKEFSGIGIDINEENFINEITYTNSNSNKNISSNLLSTSIYEVSIFSLYLKYVLKKGDLLIIEEPESHLHPENQLLLIKYIIKAVNMGLNVILTSQSEYISDKLNNIVRLNNIPEEKLSQLNYNKDEILNIDDLSIYNFKKESNTSFSTEIVNINPTGFFEKNFSPIVDKLYEESIDIINANEMW